MNACLVIMAPRHVPECIQAVTELDIPVLWLRGYTEAQLAAGVFKAALDAHPHDAYLLASDDIIIRQPALDAVVTALDAHPVVTGYSQRTHQNWTVNLTRAPLAGSHPHPDSYDFLTFQEVVSERQPLFRTWFTGMSMTGMRAELWERFPFDCYTDDQTQRGYASDFNLSLRLQQEQVPITAVREGFAYHWRNEWRSVTHALDAPLLTGSIPPEIVYEP